MTFGPRSQMLEPDPWPCDCSHPVMLAGPYTYNSKSLCTWQTRVAAFVAVESLHVAELPEERERSGYMFHKTYPQSRELCDTPPWRQRQSCGTGTDTSTHHTSLHLSKANEAWSRCSEQGKGKGRTTLMWSPEARGPSWVTQKEGQQRVRFFSC